MRRLSLTVWFLLLYAAALSADVGRLEAEWVYVPGGVPLVPPVVGSDGSVYLLCEDRYLYRLDSAGALVWRANLRRRPVSGAVGLDGFFVTALETGEVVGIGPGGGIVFRTPRRYEEPWRPVLGFEGIITIAYPSGRLEARNRAGRLLWTADVVDGISAPPVVVGGVTVIGTRGGRLIALDRYGASLWELYLGTEATAIAGGDGGRIFIGTAEGRVLSAGVSGTTYWEVFASDAISHLRVGTDELVYGTAAGDVGTIGLSGRVQTVDRLDQPPSDIYYTRRGILVLETVGRIRSMGELVIRELEGLPVHTATVTDDGAVILAAPSWEVAAFAVDVHPAGAWPLAGGSARRSGRSASFRELDDPRQRYAEELNYLYLRDLLSSPYAAEIDRALSEMISRAEEADLRGRHGYYRDLTRGLLERSVRRVAVGASTVNLPAELRSKAVRLLGLLGDSESRRILLEFSRYETEEPLLADYLESFALVASDPDGALLRRTAEILLIRQTPRIGRAAVAALHALGRSGGRTPFWHSVAFRLGEPGYGVQSGAADLRRETGDPLREAGDPSAK